jgi:hypothetical protein
MGGIAPHVLGAPPALAPEPPDPLAPVPVSPPAPLTAPDELEGVWPVVDSASPLAAPSSPHPMVTAVAMQTSQVTLMLRSSEASEEQESGRPRNARQASLP